MFPLYLIFFVCVALPYFAIAQNDTEVVLPETSNITTPDYANLKPPESTRAAVGTGTLFWPKNPTTGLYDIPIDISRASDVTRTRVNYVTAYIERATLINFRYPTASDDVVVVVKEIPNEMCWSTLGRPAGYRYIYMNLHPRICTTLHMIMHEFLHLLGFIHEHERPDAQRHYLNRLPASIPLMTSTYYDELSVMSYPYYAVGPLRDPQLSEISKGRRTFLSRCDWSMLLSLYPGKNPAPKCIPNYIANLLVPSQKLLSLHSRERAEFLCRYQNEFLFDTQYCTTTTGSRFPSLSLELGYSTSEGVGMDTSTLVTGGVPTLNDTNEATISIVPQKSDSTTNLALVENAVNITTIPDDQYYIDASLCTAILTDIQTKSFLPSCLTAPEEFCKNSTTTQNMRKWITNQYNECHLKENAGVQTAQSTTPSTQASS